MQDKRDNIRKSTIILKKLMKKPENSVCANCQELGPQYVCFPYATFVCTICSGIHRHFSHRIKGVGVSTFSSEELNQLIQGGNGVDKIKYLANWTEEKFPFPKAGDRKKIEQFIQLKYIEKLWYKNFEEDDFPPIQKVEDVMKTTDLPKIIIIEKKKKNNQKKENNQNNQNKENKENKMLIDLDHEVIIQKTPKIENEKIEKNEKIENEKILKKDPFSAIWENLENDK
ncbi:hypothetical protein M0811_13616 [Anaeramoeba ignava]|uniref:Arf-GAP domain-containing protein n=1 Tax=Anaeramoeba ignava TaxID=1746090 RepID=A0A9Q0R4Q0_ANAIG|nr:hypothetical protein M0811_13616 [Anaeramoeba ignava]